MYASVCVCACVEPFAMTTNALTLQATDDERVVLERGGLLEQFIEFRIVLVC